MRWNSVSVTIGDSVRVKSSERQRLHRARHLVAIDVPPSGEVRNDVDLGQCHGFALRQRERRQHEKREDCFSPTPRSRTWPLRLSRRRPSPPVAVSDRRAS